MPATVTVDEFRQRLEAVCVRSGMREWPAKARDQHILLKSTLYGLEPGRNYTELEINEQLARWCDRLARDMIVDHAVLRRYLVDAGYLTRDRAGHIYRLNEEKAAELFEPAIDGIDPAAVVAEARRRKEERKRRYVSRRRD